MTLENIDKGQGDESRPIHPKDQSEVELPPAPGGTPAVDPVDKIDDEPRTWAKRRRNNPKWQPNNLSEAQAISRLKFGQHVVWACLLGIVILAGIDALWIDDSSLESTGRVLQTILTLALGYVFGRGDGDDKIP